MTDIFLSYAHEDRRQAKRLARSLGLARGWSVWWDPRLRTGESYPREIQEAVAAARCVVVLWSRHSIDSNWVAAEASEGWGRGVLVPVLIDDCEPPMPFRQTQASDFATWTGAESAAEFLGLVADIERAIARGSAVSPEELRVRDQRQRRMQRQRRLRRIGWAAAVIGVPLLVGLGMLWQSGRQTAESVSARSDAVLKELLADEAASGIIRWSFLFDRADNLDRLELGALLAIEGVRHARTRRTERSLRDVWAQLPWSDRTQEFDQSNYVSLMEFSYDGSYLAAGGGCGGVLVWDLSADLIVAKIDHGGPGQAACEKIRTETRRTDAVEFSPAENLLATAGPDETARLWNPQGDELRRLQHDSSVTALRFSPSGSMLATTDLKGVVRLWEVDSGRELHQMTHDDAAHGPEFSPSGKYLATVSQDRSARVWSVATGDEIARIMHTADSWGNTVWGARFSPDEKWLATYGSGLDTVFWDIASGAQAWRLPATAHGQIVFSKDGQTMILGEDETVSWWNVASRERVGSATDSYVVDLVTEPTQRVVAAVGTDRSVRVLDFATGHLVKQMPYWGAPITVAFSPDGQWLATSGEELSQSMRLLELTKLWPEDLVADTCARLTRNMTVAEWREYLGEEPYRPTCPDIATAP